MQEKYSNTCRKIIEFYKEFLSADEIIRLKRIIKLNKYDNHDIIIFINRIIDRIWQMTLTKSESYIEGKPFKFLITTSIIPNIYNLERMQEFTESKSFFLEIIDEKNITKFHNGINGIIVEIDFIKNIQNPILPVDLKEGKYVSVKLEPKGVFNIDIGLKDFSASEQSTDTFAKITKLQKVSLNKSVYNYLENQIILNKRDENSLVNDLIIYFFIEKNMQAHNIKLRDYLNKIHKKNICNKYKKYFKNEITIQDFISYVFNLLESTPDLNMIDKTM